MAGLPYVNQKFVPNGGIDIFGKQNRTKLLQHSKNRCQLVPEMGFPFLMLPRS